jgi:dihydrofolate reductase/thymidylate synthase
MAYFKRVTMDAPPNQRNAVIMGRKTWESIPPSFRPLPGRLNVVLTKNTDFSTETNNDDVLVAHSLHEAAQKLEQAAAVHSIFVIGGAQIYQQAMEEGFCNKVLLTEVTNLPENTQFDTFFPEMSQVDGWNLVSKAVVIDTETKENAPKETSIGDLQTDAKTGVTYRFVEYVRTVNKEEMQYLDLCREIMETGVKRGDRTGTGTLSKFGTQMRFSLRDGTLPLLTTKRTFWRGVAEELLWFVSVSTRTVSLICDCIDDPHSWQLSSNMISFHLVFLVIG